MHHIVYIRWGGGGGIKDNFKCGHSYENLDKTADESPNLHSTLQSKLNITPGENEEKQLTFIIIMI